MVLISPIYSVRLFYFPVPLEQGRKSQAWQIGPENLSGLGRLGPRISAGPGRYSPRFQLGRPEYLQPCPRESSRDSKNPVIQLECYRNYSTLIKTGVGEACQSEINQAMTLGPKYIDFAKINCLCHIS